MEESRAILDEWENDREVTLIWSHSDDVFDSVVLSASRIGPVLKKTVLDYRYGHYSLLGLTEDFVFKYDLIKGTVSDYILVIECVSDRDRVNIIGDSSQPVSVPPRTFTVCYNVGHLSVTCVCNPGQSGHTGFV